MEEVWKTITYAKNYQISNLGNVKNIKRNNLIKVNYERLKKTNTRARVGITNNDNKSKGYYLHRIVAEHFIDNPNNLPEVNHKNGDFYDNTLTNLEWISKLDNMKHANENNLMNKFKRQIQVINKLTNVKQMFNSLTECAKHFNCGIGTISQICNNKKKQNKGGRSRSLKPIIQYDLNEKILNKFISHHEASEKLNIPFGGINQCCNYHKYNDTDRPKSYKIKSCHGFIFKFDTSETTNQTTVKKRFDDFEITFLDFQQNDTNYNQDTEQLENVIWKPYPELDKYLVSNTGEVKHKRTNRILKGSKVNGYRFVNLNRDDGTKRNCLIHRLVAETFLENPKNKPVVNHKDTNILNNSLNNLEWVTHKENMNTKETIENLKKGRNSKTILQIDIETGNIINKFYGASEGNKLLNIDGRTILMICNYYHGKKTNAQTQKRYQNRFIFVFEEDKGRLNDILKIAKSKPNFNTIKVEQIDKTTNKIINTFESGSEASRQLNIPYTGINHCCNYYKYNDKDRPPCYKLKSYKGFIFKQLEMQ
jgi:hypothetical protein